ncbi:hypothetical protein [uncultured Corynebacterium sp.]|uniref:hypothetical protein n=1 Tax=uncultured Corynebacterium sp. TaxID=159447 RepID=UPI0025CF2274|nr:hypothetical protein [uncultured Corynebacterium sp.]
MGLRPGGGCGNRLGCHILPFDWMQKAGLAGTVIGFTIRALPLTGGGVSFAMAALGRTHAFIAGWALMLRGGIK